MEEDAIVFWVGIRSCSFCVEVVDADILKFASVTACAEASIRIRGALATLLKWIWSPDLTTFTASSAETNLISLRIIV
jgi:hypothetical protein